MPSEHSIRQQYEEAGYLIIENFLTPEEVDEIKKEGEKLADNIPPERKIIPFSNVDSVPREIRRLDHEYTLKSADKIGYFFELDAVDVEKGEIKITDKKTSLHKLGHALCELNPIFKKYTFHDKVKKYCKDLGFDDAVVVQSMFLFKNPKVGSEFVIHQDASYLHTEPVKVIGFWYALEDATLENGCLWFLKGSHKDGIHRRFIRNPDTNSEERLVYTAPNPDYDMSKFTPAPVKKGTCVILHGQVVHYSAHNTSDKSRHAYTFHIQDSSVKWSEGNWLQRPKENPFWKLNEH